MLKGIDISKWQGNPDQTRVRAAGYAFCIYKVTQGLTWIDPRFKDEWEEGGELGTIRGVYHFGRFEVSAEKQVEFFVKTVEEQGVEFPDIPHSYDFETYGGTYDIQPRVAVSHGLRAVRHLRKIAGVKPIVYMPDWLFFQFLRGYRKDGVYYAPAPEIMEFVEEAWLWLADYSPTPRAMPWPVQPWGTPYTLWQKSGHGSVPGVAGNCDLNEFPGTEAQLRSLVEVP